MCWLIKSVLIPFAVSLLTAIVTTRITRKIEDRHYSSDHRNEDKHKAIQNAPELQSMFLNEVFSNDKYTLLPFVHFWVDEEQGPVTGDEKKGNKCKTVYRVHFTEMSKRDAEAYQKRNSHIINWQFFLVENNTSSGLEFLSFESKINSMRLDISNESNPIVKSNQIVIYFGESKDAPKIIRARYRGYRIYYNIEPQGRLSQARPE